MKKPTQSTIYSYPDLRLGIQTSGIQEEHQILLQHDEWLLSPILDSGHEGTIWDRLFLTMEYEIMQCLIWCFDTSQQLTEDKLSKEAVLLSANASHILLKKAKGRYLRFLVLNKGDQAAVFNGYECIFPYRTHLELLPQYYQSNEDLHLLFAPIEDVFLSLQAQIRTMHHMWDVKHGSEEQLNALLELLDLQEFQVFPVEVLREVLVKRHTWMNQRGTLPSLKHLATILLQRNVIIELETQSITIIASYHHEKEAKTVTSILEHEVPFGTALHMKWLMNATFDFSYFDLGMYLDQGIQTGDLTLDTGVYLWE